MTDYLEPITVIDRVTLPCAAAADRSDTEASIEVEIVAIPRKDGSACLVDAFFNPERFAIAHGGAILGDHVFLSGLKAALRARDLPAETLDYLDADAQDEHCVGLAAGEDLGRAVLAWANYVTASA